MMSERYKEVIKEASEISVKTGGPVHVMKEPYTDDYVICCNPEEYFANKVAGYVTEKSFLNGFCTFNRNMN